MRTNTQEAVLSAYIASVGKRTPRDAAQDAAELCRLANSLNRLNEIACNYGLTERQERRKQNLQTMSMAVEKGAKTAVVWLLFTLPLSLLEGVFSQNGPQRSRARRCCAAKRTLHGEDRSEILDKRERGGPEWTAKM